MLYAQRKNIIILITAISIILIVLISVGVFVIIKNARTSQQSHKTIQEVKKEQLDNMAKAYKQRFPDIVKGTMNIISDNKSSIKLASGQEYSISPSRPVDFYKEINVVSGSFVEIQGKIMDNNTISLGNIRLTGE